MEHGACVGSVGYFQWTYGSTECYRGIGVVEKEVEMRNEE